MASGRWRLSSRGDPREILRHPSKEMRRRQLAPIAEKNIHQLGRTLADGFDFQVVPGAARANRLGEMDQLLGDGSAVSASRLMAAARRDQGCFRADRRQVAPGNASISASLESQSSRSSTVRVSRSARTSCLRIDRASGAATTAQSLSLPNILCFQSLPESSRRTLIRCRRGGSCFYHAVHNV